MAGFPAPKKLSKDREANEPISNPTRGQNCAFSYLSDTNRLELSLLKWSQPSFLTIGAIYLNIGDWDKSEFVYAADKRKEMTIPHEHRSILVFAVRNEEVAILSYSTPSEEGVYSMLKVALGLIFGKSKPVPKPDEYVAIDWDIIKVIPKTAKISKISESGIVMLLPNIPLPELQDLALEVKQWIMEGEMRREVEKQFELLAIEELIRRGKIK